MLVSTNAAARIRAGAIAALVTFALAAPAGAATTPTDAWLTTKVKVSLATTEGVDVTEVHVDTVRREVTLHGTVNTPAERSLAERTAKAVEGVDSVRNLLQVVAVKNEARVEASDEVLRERVSAALAADASLKDSAIAVQSVNKGLVLLKGKAASLSDLLTAIEITRGVEGTRRVASEVQSEDTLVEADVWKERNIAVGGGSAAPPASGAGTDLYTTSMVKMRLLANGETPAMDINVDTRAGAVTLFGIVPTAASKAAAEAEAGKTIGVTSVKNQLQVVPAAKQPAVEVKDEAIQADITKSLASANLGQVDCEVRNCVARLTGKVASGMDRIEALQIARATKGVCSVKDDLVIE